LVEVLIIGKSADTFQKKNINQCRCFEKRGTCNFKVVQIVGMPDYLHRVEIVKRDFYFYFETFLLFFHDFILKKSEYLITSQIFFISLSISLSSKRGALTDRIFP